MGSRINVFAIATPSPGKVDRFLEQFDKMAQHVQANEPGTLKYEISRQVNKESGAEEFYISEVYADNAAVKAHMASEPMKAFTELTKAEALFARPLQIKVLKVVGGFSRL